MLTIDIDSYIGKYFPNNYNFVKQNIELSKSAVKAPKDKELEEYFNKYTYNLPLNIHSVQSKSISPFTIPALIDTKLLDNNINLNKILINAPILNDLYGLSVSNQLLLKANIDAKVDENSNKIIFTYNNNFDKLKLHIFQPTGFVKLFKNKDIKLRFAIALHEIGHWVNITEYNIQSVIKILSNILIIVTSVTFGLSLNIIAILVGIFLIEIFILNIVSSINEHRSDMFVKKLGYGKELSESLHIVGSKLSDNSLQSINVIKLEANTLKSNISNVVNKFLVGYPSIERRIYNLLESEYDKYDDYLIHESIDINIINKMLLSLHSNLISFANNLDSKVKL